VTSGRLMVRRLGAAREGRGVLPVAPTPGLRRLALRDALPISAGPVGGRRGGRGGAGRLLGDGAQAQPGGGGRSTGRGRAGAGPRSEEHTSELQSRENLVCRLLLEKKNGFGVRVGIAAQSTLQR